MIQNTTHTVHCKINVDYFGLGNYWLFGWQLYYYEYKMFASHLAAIWSSDQLFLFLHPGWGATVIGQ